jgi:hypothetical protein
MEDIMKMKTRILGGMLAACGAIGSLAVPASANEDPLGDLVPHEEDLAMNLEHGHVYSIFDGMTDRALAITSGQEALVNWDDTAINQQWTALYVGVNPYQGNKPMYQFKNKATNKCLTVSDPAVAPGKRDLIELTCGTAGVSNAPVQERRQWFTRHDVVNDEHWKRLVPFEYPGMILTAPNSGCGSPNGRPYVANQPQHSGPTYSCSEWGFLQRS